MVIHARRARMTRRRATGSPIAGAIVSDDIFFCVIILGDNRQLSNLKAGLLLQVLGVAEVDRYHRVLVSHLCASTSLRLSNQIR